MSDGDDGCNGSSDGRELPFTSFPPAPLNELALGELGLDELADKVAELGEVLRGAGSGGMRELRFEMARAPTASSSSMPRAMLALGFLRDAEFGGAELSVMWCSSRRAACQ